MPILTMSELLFNRRTGEVFLTGPGDGGGLLKFLAKHHKDAVGFEVIRPNGYVRIRAVDREHLDVTTIPIDGILT
jgi:hypothetical protein